MVSLYGGNLSMRIEDKICITRSGSKLGYLTDDDLVLTDLIEIDENTNKASSELMVHRAIYRQTPFKAVVHAHPVHAVLLSAFDEKIMPSDEGGILFIPEIPVIGFGTMPGPGKFAEEIGSALNRYAAVVVYRHGSFARGMTLEEAFAITELLEISCRLIYMEKILKK
jgi:L-fuculose-phosphate aldolase